MGEQQLGHAGQGRVVDQVSLYVGSGPRRPAPLASQPGQSAFQPHLRPQVGLFHGRGQRWGEDAVGQLRFLPRLSLLRFWWRRSGCGLPGRLCLGARRWLAERRGRAGQLADLGAGERPAQVAHRPPRVKDDRFPLMDVVQQEYPRAQRRDHLVEISPAQTARSDFDAFQPVQQPLLVPVGLHPADEPGPGVR